jgi:hypothetical protein
MGGKGRIDGEKHPATGEKTPIEGKKYLAEV